MVDTSIPCLVAVSAGAASLLLEIVAVATTSWFSASISIGGFKVTATHGLFRSCNSGRCSEYNQSDWVRATAAFAVLGLLLQVGAMVVLLLRMFLKSLREKRLLSLLVLALAWGAFGCFLLSIIIYGAKQKDHLGYSYILACIAAIVQLVMGLVLVVMHARSSK